MGIRIHKSLGWGNDKAKNHLKKDADLDQILDISSQDFCKEIKKNIKEILEFHNDGVNQYVKKRKDDYILSLYALKDGDQKWSPRDSVQTPSEYRKYIQIIPIGYDDWKRYDDPIDYVEEDGIAKDKFKYLRKNGIWHTQGLYPYIGMHPIKEPELNYGLSEDLITTFNPYNPSDYAMLIGTWDGQRTPIAKGKVLQNLINDWRPMIPIEVSCMAWFIRDALHDPVEFTKSLRPSIFIHWG